MVLTREYLATYTLLESEIKRIRRRIRYYETHPIQMVHGIVKGSRREFPYTECHFVISGASPKSDKERQRQMSQLLVDLKGNERVLEDMKLDIETFLETLPPEDLEVKQILAMKYVDGMTDSEIAERMFCDRRTVSRKINRFFSKSEGKMCEK